MTGINNVRAVVFSAPGSVEIGVFSLGICGDAEIVVRTLYTMVSTGTELRVLSGFYGSAGKFPLIPGYAVVGEVISVGAAVKGFIPGDLVSGRNPNPLPGVTGYWGGQASLHVYPIHGEGRPVLLPVGCNPLHYAIAEISAISLRGVEAAAPQPGETAVVIGQGPIGAFSASWLQARGCRVIVTDTNPGRLDRALARGAFAAVKSSGREPAFSVPAGDTNPLQEDSSIDEELEERLGMLLNGGADIVVESSGTTTGALLSYRLVRKKPQAYGDKYKVEPIGYYHQDWPRLIMQANYLHQVPINPFSFFRGEGITILAPKDRGVEDRQKAIEAIRRGHIDPHAFIDQVIPYEQAPDAYRRLIDQPGFAFSVIIDWTTANS